MSWDAITLTVQRFAGNLAELVRAQWYVVLPAALALVALVVLRWRYWPANGLSARWRGLLVDVSEQHDLVVLIHAARQDAEFRGEVMRLLELPPDTRLALLESTLAAMREKGAPDSFVEAIGLLRDEHVVEETRRLLTAVE
jgi:hypothetical protein